MKVTIYHNEGPGRFFKFDADTARLVDKGTYELNEDLDGHWLATEQMIALERVFELFNVGDPTDPRVQEYRNERRARSLSVGDVVVLGEVAYAVAGFGFDLITTREFEKAREDTA